MDFVSDYVKRQDRTSPEADRDVNRAQDRQPVESGPVFLRPDTNRKVDLLRYRC